MDEPLSALPFRAGDLIAGKYRVDSVLGAGGMGVVLEATHLDLDRKVAVKVIRPELASDEALVERLLLEARAAARIKSEHVGKVLDVSRLPGGAPYIVMEFLEGRDLGALLELRGSLPVTDSVDLLLQACEAIAEAHTSQIVHRDLKPENLFVLTLPGGALSIKVLDFGISKQLGDPMRRALTNPTTAVGSPQYMAPEQMRAEDIDTRVDVWALGAILYELLSGQKAFDADTVPAICAKVLADEPKPLRSIAPHVPVLLEQVVQRCLLKQRAERFESVAALAEALAPFGSAQADLSFRRIRAVSGHVSRIPAELAETVRAEGRVSIGGTAKGISRTIVGQHSSAPPQPKLRPKLWPVFAGVTATATLAVLLWFWARTPPDRARAALTLGPESSAAAAAASAQAASGALSNAAPSSAVALSGPASVDAPSSNGAAASVLGEPAASPSAGSSASPTPSLTGAAPSGSSTAAPSAGSGRPPPPRPHRYPARPAGSHEASPAPPASSSAWDPDNFGARH